MTFGGEKQWRDVEGDESVFRKQTDEDEKDESKQTSWEQWAGLIQRGKPGSLILVRTNAAKTQRRAPGPGAITKTDWRAMAEKNA